MEIGAIIVGLLKLGMLILQEVFAAKKRAREAQEKFELTQAKFLEISEKCIAKLKAEIISDSKQAQSIEDKMDGGGR